MPFPVPAGIPDGGLSLQGGSDLNCSSVRVQDVGQFIVCFSQISFGYLVAYAFTDLAGFDGLRRSFSFFIGSRIDQSMIGLSLYRLVGLFHRYMERPSRALNSLTDWNLYPCMTGLTTLAI